MAALKITKKLLKTVLYQANQKYNNGPGDVFTVSALRSASLAEYQKVLDALTKDGYLEESGEPDYYKVTHRGEMFGTGQKCPCKECRPQDYA
jgi:predicted transcriptional regulator